MRRSPSGTLLYNNGEIKFLNTGTKYTMSAAVYPSWHPNGNLIAFSVNIIRQRFHSAGDGLIYVYDLASDIIVYDIAKNQVTTCPALSTGRLENMPAWSHDGRYLYYISGPKYDKNKPDSCVKYDLLRIAYNAENSLWGNVDTLLTAGKTGKSITYPQLSPDDKFLTFAMSDYGYFNVFSKTSDLYIMNTANLQYSEMPVNSPDAESFHGWSSSGRWILFASKRIDGLFSNVFFSHIDSAGNASKPFVLPQKDPDFYSRYTLNFNRPVFIKDKVGVSINRLVKAAYSKKVEVEFDPDVEIDALSGATRIERDVMKEHTN